MELSSGEEFDQQLVDAVRKQIEYYFSKENLQSDAYLTSQMDAQMSVPLSVVMKFAKLKALTQDEAVVRRALVDSSLSLVDNRIKANIKASGRSTIILREIPSDAAEEEVKEIFNYDGCKRILSIRSEIGDTWFVVMESEEDAKDTALDLRLKKRTFRGQPVKARIKTEAVVRSFFPSVAPAPSVYPPLHLPFPPVSGVVPAPMLDLANFGYLPVPPVVEANSNVVVELSEVVPVESTVVTAEVKTTSPVPAEAPEINKTTEEETEVPKLSSTRGRDVRKVSGRPSRDQPPSSDKRRAEPRKIGTPTHPNKETRERKPDAPVSKPPIEVNAMTFPPLQGLEDTPVPTPGYKDTYQKYSFDSIISIVKNVKEALLPTDLNPADHPLAMTATPNMDLLKRQRTFSIDETREQLRQGRPVQREAIISGAVDYRSLMYGDDHDLHKSGLMNHRTVANQGEAASSVSASQINAIASSVTDLTKAVEEHCSIARGDSVDKDQQQKSVVSSPQRISASTWAAMVKSSAQATENSQTNTIRNPSATKSSPIAENVASINHNKLKESNGEKPAHSSSTPSKHVDKEGDKEKDRERRSHHRSDRRKQRDGENKPLSSDNQESKNDDSGSKTTTESITEASNATGGAWGKTSFASVLKQTLPEDVHEQTKKPTELPSSSENNQQKPLKLNSRGSALRDSHNDNKGSSNHHRDRDSRDQHHRGGGRHREHKDRDRDRPRDNHFHKRAPVEKEKEKDREGEKPNSDSMVNGITAEER